MIAQDVTEDEVTRSLREKGVEVWRGEQYKVVGMSGTGKGGDEDAAVVELESGERIEARYVIGADGARSIVSLIFTSPSTPDLFNLLISMVFWTRYFHLWPRRYAKYQAVPSTIPEAVAPQQAR